MNYDVAHWAKKTLYSAGLVWAAGWARTIDPWSDLWRGRDVRSTASIPARSSLTCCRVKCGSIGSPWTGGIRTRPSSLSVSTPAPRSWPRSSTTSDTERWGARSGRAQNKQLEPWFFFDLCRWKVFTFQRTPQLNAAHHDSFFQVDKHGYVISFPPSNIVLNVASSNPSWDFVPPH